MKRQIRKRSLAYWLIALIALFGLIFLTGASGQQQVGRYRMQVVIRGNFTDIFVIDTATGVVKWLGDDQGKPFEAVKGR